PLAHADQPNNIAAGLSLTFEQGGVRDARVARLIGLAVPEGSRPTPLLPPGPFTATWSGSINLKLRGEYAFTAHGNGSVELTINNDPALSASGDDLAVPAGKHVKLKKRANAVQWKYSDPPS